MPDFAAEKRIYFVRHGQSEGNVAPVFQSTDSPLSKHGEKQARCIAERAARLSFDALIASPLPRARATAAAIATTTGKRPEYSELFVERIKPSSINGKPYTDREAEKIWKEWDRSLYTAGMRTGDGENYDDLVSRADKALAFLEQRPEKEIVVVTHSYFLRMIVARVLLADALTPRSFKNMQSRMEMENTGLSIIEYIQTYGHTAPVWRLWVYNDHYHLG